MKNKLWHGVFILFLTASSMAIGQDEPSSFDVTTALGDTVDPGFARALKPRRFIFPQDHGAHPTFRNEWWYVTGNLETKKGHRFGYQLTFFRIGLSPDKKPRKSHWASNQIWMAHVAVTNISANQHHAVERFSREALNLAGANASPFHVWLEDWSIKETPAGDAWQLLAKTDQFSLELSLNSLSEIILQGNQGLSQKSSAQGNASYYYSIPRLKTQGNITFEDNAYKVAGLSWLDREWSTSVLADNQTGWDWFSLQFTDGTNLMYYRLRNQNGEADSHSGGSVSGKNQQQKILSAHDVKLTPLEWWTSSKGKRYPVSWRFELMGVNNAYLVTAAVKDQEVDLLVKYWEGAVDIFNETSHEKLGSGYLEMTGY